MTTPTEDVVRDACEIFDRENSVIEESLKELFSQYPSNKDVRHVLLKVVALNALYSTRIFVYSEKVPNVVDVARRIHEHVQDVDSALDAGSPELVDRIAMVTVPGKKDRKYFSFATKYCSWHKPESYPIWDANVERYLGCLQKQTGFARDFDVNGYWDYPRFREVMTAFRERYDLGSFGFKEIDKFLWLYGGRSDC
ncbi:MAG: hypothetical protein ACLQVN_25120 [Bryobacteraceae bacterium]